MSFGSSYENFHGVVRKELPCEADILKYKILSDLEYVKHLKPVPL